MDFMMALRVWIGFVAIMAFGNTVQCFFDHSFLANRLYTGAPDLANSLAARLFGVWTLLAGILRFYCSICIYNRQVYNLTLVSFALAFGHFASECWIYGTAPLTVGVMAPLIVSTISFSGMLVGYLYLPEGRLKTT